MHDVAPDTPQAAPGSARRRNRVFAAFCSLIVPGSGQVYLGQVVIGLVWFAAAVTLYVVSIALFLQAAPIGLVSLLLPLGVHLVCFIDALDPQSLGPPRDVPIVRHGPAQPGSPWPLRFLIVGLVGIFLVAIVAGFRPSRGADRPLSLPDFRVAAHEGQVYLVVLNESPGFGDVLWQIVDRLQGRAPAIEVHFWTRENAGAVPSHLPIPRVALCNELGEITVNRTTGVRRFTLPPTEGCR
ncbi:MAG: hypothetical protein KGN76_05910 [Acidobacteriota bacterium]|nr:hypothetical protein [Acidobacteriota bacterium]